MVTSTLWSLNNLGARMASLFFQDTGREQELIQTVAQNILAHLPEDVLGLDHSFGQSPEIKQLTLPLQLVPNLVHVC